MKIKLFLRMILILTLMIPFIQFSIYFDSLPDKVASHFNSSGYADGYMSKGSFLFLMGGITLFVGGLFVGLSFFLKKLPLSLLNVPNKDYWFVEDRKDKSLELTEIIFSLMGIATMLFFITISQLTISYNLQPHPKPLEKFWIFLVAFLTIIFSLVGYMYYRFRKPKQNH